ncbi:MAG TPA: amidohydrolase [Thermoplasmata archaeon]|nr:amidohydrolase [Thermoplasmata archaeon]
MTHAVRFTGGSIFTGERFVEAILVEDGLVRAVGSEAAIRRDAPTGADTVELHGRLAIPGLVDAHLHVPDLTQAREGLDLSTARSTPEVLERVRRWAEAHPQGPIVGRGWSPDRTEDRRWLTARDLDGAVDARPVVVYHASGHAAVANTAAFAALGLGPRSPDPAGGRLDRAPDGTPSGPVFESALRLLTPVSWATPPDPEGFVRTLRAAARLGLTTVATLNLSPEGVAAFRALAARRALPIRVRAYVQLARFREFPDSLLGPVPGAESWAVVGGKGFTDGAFGPRTAWLRSAYEDDPTSDGLPVASEPELREAIAWGSDHGLAPALHAIGDRAVERAARLLEPYRVPGGRRPRIEHASLAPPELFPALERARPALVVQPGFVWSDHWLSERLGPARTRWAYPFRTLTDHGFLLAGSSDAPYDPLDPWRGLAAAVHRTDPDGRSANPASEEALTAEEALRLYGRNAGLVLGEEPLGTLEVGAPGDVVLLRAVSAAAAVEDGAGGVVGTWRGGARIADDDPPRQSA